MRGVVGKSRFRPSSAVVASDEQNSDPSASRGVEGMLGSCCKGRQALVGLNENMNNSQLTEKQSHTTKGGRRKYLPMVTSPRYRDNGGGQKGVNNISDKVQERPIAYNVVD
jgi:hypothetical protein